jgi:diadenosine tetraphosphate (Ap4A) HIT family hydrolase
MTTEAWQTLRDQAGCPMDAPRPAANQHWDLVATLSISSLYLAANQTYKGHCQLVFDRRHACRADQLTRAEWRAYSDDLFTAQHAILLVTRPDHLNVELLGNVVPHLHWHIVPRYFNDPRWGMPIWTTPLSDMPDTKLGDAERRALVEALRGALAEP